MYTARTAGAGGALLIEVTARLFLTSIQIYIAYFLYTKFTHLLPSDGLEGRLSEYIVTATGNAGRSDVHNWPQPGGTTSNP